MSIMKLVSVKGKEFALEKDAVASINPKACVNCGTCRELCPVEAISENQRTVCRACPECTEKPTMPIDEMYALATEKSCTTACPLGISPQGYVNLIKDGKLDEAYKLVWDKNPLPSICSRICHHPCEQACKRGLVVDTPIAIRALKRYLSEKIEYKPDKYPRLYEETIAIIGAGPAGLTASHYLSRFGYEVTIYESEIEAGGMLLRGIPEFRLDRNVVKREIANLEAAGLTIKLSENINKFSFEKIKKEHDVVIVATGAPQSKELDIEGRRLTGVMTAMELMGQVNNNQEVHRHPSQLFKMDGEVVVIGGGSVAIDTARTARRLGASKVTAICLESGEDVPCHDWELEEAKEEGVTLLEGYSPSRFVGDAVVLKGVEVCKVTSFYKDESGKISFTVDPEDKQIIKADWAIIAIGQKANEMWSDVAGNNVFFAGDVNSSDCSVIDAMASGRKIAFAVDASLRGRALKDPAAKHELHDAPMLEKIFPYTRRRTVRPDRPMIPVEERIHTFKEVEGSFNDEQAQAETQRCLNCGYQVVDEDKCIGCGVCQKICPKGNVITMVPINKGGATE